MTKENTDAMYVISAKVKPYKSEEYRWEYFQFDDHSGSFSTGYPCFGYFESARIYNTVDRAKEVFEKSKDDLYRYYKNNILWETLAIREIKFKTIGCIDLKM